MTAAHDIKIAMRDFNAKIWRKDALGSSVGKFSLHNNTFDNGFRLVSFASASTMVVSGTRFPHKDIHNRSWISLDQNTRNHIDHVVIEGRHVSSVMDVRVKRGANIDSDNNLVAAKLRTRLSSALNTRNQTQRNLDITSAYNRDAYSYQLSELLQTKIRQSDTSETIRCYGSGYDFAG